MLAVTATAAGLRPPLGERVGLFHCHNHRHLTSRSPGPRQPSFAAPFSVFQESHTVGPVLKSVLMQAQGIRQSQPQGHAHIPGEVKMHLPEFRVWVPALCSKALTPHVSLNQDRANSTNPSFSLGSWGGVGAPAEQEACGRVFSPLRKSQTQNWLSGKFLHQPGLFSAFLFILFCSSCHQRPLSPCCCEHLPPP